MPTERTQRRLTAILSADAVGYSRLMAADEAGTVRLLTEFRQILSDTIDQYGGRVVDAPGDNLLAEFPSVVDAVQCAVEIQGELARRNAELPEERRMRFRIGVNLGDVVVEGDRIYGDGVNVAARLEGLAEPGGVCVSGPAYDQIKNKLRLGWEALGEQSVKNLPEPIRVYRVRTEDGSRERALSSGAPRRRRRRLRAVLAATAGALLLLAVGLWVSWPRPLGLLVDLSGVGGPPIDPSLPDKPSLAILPFVNMSGDPEQEYFSDGLTEDLTTDLARVPEIFVISRNSAFTYKAKPVKVEDVGRELGVRYVVEGSVRRAGDRVRITAQLIDATTGGHLWSARYDRDLSEVFALQSEIAEEILGAVHVEIGAAESRRLARKPTLSLTAIEAWWKAVYHLNRVTREDNQRARQLFERAIELEPGFAGAYGMLGNTYSSEVVAGWSSDARLLDRAEELARRAIALDDSAPDGHMTLAWVHLHRGDSIEAIAAADRVIELAPSWEFAHAVRGLALAQEGRLFEGTRSVRQALRLNPRAPTMLVSVAGMNYLAGRKEKAVEQLERVRTASPDNINARVILAAHYEREGQHGRASIAVDEILRVVPDYSVERAGVFLRPYENALGSQEFAAYQDALREAGLPAQGPAQATEGDR